MVGEKCVMRHEMCIVKRVYVVGRFNRRFCLDLTSSEFKNSRKGQ